MDIPRGRRAKLILKIAFLEVPILGSQNFSISKYYYDKQREERLRGSAKEL
jgi:hypothetical protein